MWHYKGEVDESGNKLNLEAEGPGPNGDDSTLFRETTEFVSDDHRVFTSSYQDEDGEWVEIVKVEYRRKADEEE